MLGDERVPDAYFVPDRDRYASVRSVVDRLASERADEVFLISSSRDQSITFAQLAGKAHALAARLHRLGAVPGDRVAFLLNNSIHTAELFLSIMYCGFVAVPLNVAAGQASLAQTIVDSGARTVFFGDEHALLLAGIRQALNEQHGGASLAHCIPYAGAVEHAGAAEHVDAVEQAGAVEAVDADEAIDALVTHAKPDRCIAVPEADSDALIAYTSGSTGKPKGALFTHRSLLVGGWNTVLAHDLSTQDRSLCVLPLYHMNAQIVTLMSTLISGGCVIVPSHFNPNAFWQQVSDFRCTWFALVPSIITQLIETTNLTADQMQRLRSHVRFARSSSAPLSKAAHLQFEEKFELPLIEAMGMTEAGGAIFSNPLPPRERKRGSPGLPFGFEVAVVDDSGASVGRGSVGEIMLKGESVMKGYYNQPPGANISSIRDGYLSTGDLGWQDDDGFIFIVGRKTEMINKGGEKFAPREVEEFLQKQGAVLEVAIVSVPDPHLGQDAVAFVVPRNNTQETECLIAELGRVCQEQLGSVKTPSRFYILQSLPRGTAHKIDRKQLQKLAAELVAPHMMAQVESGLGMTAASKSPYSVLNQRAAGNTVAANASLSLEEIERRVLAIMADVLNYPQLQVEDNFFDAGGYSLRGLQLLSRLGQTFSCHVPVGVLFQGPTARQIARYIHEQLAPTESVQRDVTVQRVKSLVPIRDSGSRRPLFITPGGNGSDEEFLVYARLIRHLSPQYPVYGLRARSSMLGVKPHASVEEMARDYLLEVREIQPHGPYFLIGECTGGVIAFEMARQLKQQNQDVGMLLLLDAVAPDRLHYSRQRIKWFCNSVLRMLQKLRLSTEASFQSEPGSLDEPSVSSSRGNRERDAMWLAYKRPLLQYCPQEYDGELCLLFSQEYFQNNAQESWRSVRTKETKIRSVKGDHHEYIRACAESVSVNVMKILESAECLTPAQTLV